MLLRDLSQSGKFSDAGIGEKNINSPLGLDGLVETIQVRQFGNISPDADGAGADEFHGIIEFLLATASDEDISALLDEEFGRGQPYSGSAAGDDCHFSLQLTHSR